MRIEISNHSKIKLTNNERDRIYELTNKCINTYHLRSVENNGTVVTLECVPEKCAEEIAKLLSNQYEISVTEDSFMAQIDLIDMLSGGLW